MQHISIFLGLNLLDKILCCTAQHEPVPQQTIVYESYTGIYILSLCSTASLSHNSIEDFHKPTRNKNYSTAILLDLHTNPLKIQKSTRSKGIRKSRRIS